MFLKNMVHQHDRQVTNQARESGIDFNSWRLGRCQTADAEIVG